MWLANVAVGRRRLCDLRVVPLFNLEILSRVPGQFGTVVSLRVSKRSRFADIKGETFTLNMPVL